MRQFITLMIFTVLASVSTGPVVAQQDQVPPAPFCENNEGFGDWDFWIGEWNVYSNNEARTFAGTNSITKHYNNCLIKELWVSSNGTGGFSVNYFNPNRDEWRQVWVSNGYSIDYTGGLNDQGAMVLKGEIYTYATGVTSKFRGIWTPEENGDVIQHFDAWDAGKEAWVTWFEGRYVRKESDSNPPAGK
jgi:hypothetical protein